jgi:hypothetical protein
MAGNPPVTYYSIRVQQNPDFALMATGPDARLQIYQWQGSSNDAMLWQWLNFPNGSVFVSKQYSGQALVTQPGYNPAYYGITNPTPCQSWPSVFLSPMTLGPAGPSFVDNSIAGLWSQMQNDGAYWGLCLYNSGGSYINVCGAGGSASDISNNMAIILYPWQGTTNNMLWNIQAEMTI